MILGASRVGNEIDLVLEMPKEVFAIEVKATSRPSSRDARNLLDFKLSDSSKKLKKFLIHQGQEYKTFEDVSCLPAAAMFCSY
ncbi:MAG: hypothetical protein COT74_04425 [Bdellovibrionales bacterium CG10_big_fil_rev_8_21_14_0_10_45_34]|nr:MAG: hypothetical protein COT74_04425 [Bdellovibrionales bacterium CG10_big_fil_rev_8_21_14_0_10_45_34]